MGRKKLRTTTVILGIIVALAIAFSQYVPQYLSSPDTVKTEQADKAGEEGKTVISLPTFSLPAPFNVQTNLDAYCLFEILFEVDRDEAYVEEDVFYTNYFFQTMFRVIISPNAP